MKITLTGSSGYVGSRLLKRLALGHEVQRLSHMVPHAEISPMISAFQPELVIHVGSLFVAAHRNKDIEALLASNVAWPTHLLEACREGGVKKFINTGTCWQSWNDTEIPATLYAATKSAFEKILEFYSSAYSISSMNLRLIDTYGPNDGRGKLVSKLVEVFRGGIELEMSPGEQWLNLVHIDDVVDGFMHAIELIVAEVQMGAPDAQQIHNFELASQTEIQLKDLLQICERISGRKSPVRLGARPYREREVMRPTHRYPQLPGWKPKIDLESGIRELFDER